ncbi:MAG TPA: M28 family peptidase [Kofleriaceae bacterium]|nr:M28 family peptidase [Kofleriaceae bacterium]
MASVVAAVAQLQACDTPSDEHGAQVAELTTSALASTSTLLSASFDADANGFTYADNTFRGAAQPAYASGVRVATGGQPGGALRVDLGGVDNNTISGMSGGWSRSFTTAEPLRVALSVQYNLTQTAEYESDEVSQVLVGVDGQLRGISTRDLVAQIAGDGNGGAVRTTGWRSAVIDVGLLASGNHTLIVGAFNSKKTAQNESMAVLCDNLVLTGKTVPSARLVLEARFGAGADGFAFVDDPFDGTAAPAYASGAHGASAGRSGGGLTVALGGVNGTTVTGMSGGWRRTFTTTAAADLGLSFRYNLTQTPEYEADERSRVMVTLDGVELGLPPGTTPPDLFVDQVVGDGNGGAPVTTGWRLARIALGVVPVGDHVLTIGGFNSKKTLADESTSIALDDVTIATAPPVDPAEVAGAIVEGLSFQRFVDNIQTLASFGDRSQLNPAGSASYDGAVAWVRHELELAGYGVEGAAYVFQGVARESIYATKVGLLFPDRVYIISAHLDGRGGGGGADDDGSGSSLVLEAARALAGVEVDASVRFVFWNNEESGLNGSAGHATSRAALQGIEAPAGSRVYQEPTWLGIIQHDMILFDHGLPPGPTQSPTADVDIEFQVSSTRAIESQALAGRLLASNGQHATDYPAEVSNNMSNTDSASFRDLAASVSVRENRRIAEIGNGANPNWHQATDLFTTYSELDFRLGFNALQTTLGGVAELAGAQAAP